MVDNTFDVRYMFQRLKKPVLKFKVRKFLILLFVEPKCFCDFVGFCQTEGESRVFSVSKLLSGIQQFSAVTTSDPKSGASDVLFSGPPSQLKGNIYFR